LHPNAVNNKSDPTSDEPASVAVETVTVLTESLKGQQGLCTVGPSIFHMSAQET